MAAKRKRKAKRARKPKGHTCGCACVICARKNPKKKRAKSRARARKPIRCRTKAKPKAHRRGCACVVCASRRRTRSRCTSRNPTDLLLANPRGSGQKIGAVTVLDGHEGNEWRRKEGGAYLRKKVFDISKKLGKPVLVVDDHGRRVAMAHG